MDFLDFPSAALCSFSGDFHLLTGIASDFSKRQAKFCFAKCTESGRERELMPGDGEIKRKRESSRNVLANGTLAAWR